MIKAETRLGKFKVIRPIGKGGMADVYLAEDTSLGREVALKVLPPELARNSDWVARFEREVRATANLFHPHVVTVYDVGNENNVHFYAMEYLPCGDLKQKISDGLTVHQSLLILKQIAEALKYAHSKGFIHRDIKPENILFDENDRAKLTDLGIAKTLDNSATVTKIGQSIGTPRYISPEQAQGNPLDGRSDLYSLGIVFYEMLTGEVPFDAEEPLAIALAHISKEVPQLPLEFVEYQDFLDAMLAKSKEDRFSSADEVIQAIELFEQNKAFKLEEFYQQRTANQADILNFGAISSTLDHGISKKWWFSVVVLVAVVTMGFWKSDVIIERFNQSQAPVSSKSHFNTVESDGPTGVIQVESHPSGASVFLGGLEVGVTPYLGQSLPTGEHRLKLTHALFADLEAIVVIRSDKITHQQFKLKAGTGNLFIHSNPSGAWIELDGIRLKATTPHRVEQIESGKHQLVIGKDHLLAELEIAIPHAKEQRIMAELKAGKLAYYPGSWLPIDKLYLVAQQLIEQNHLSYPAGNNAEEAYRAILKVDPNQKQAADKLFEIGNMHWQIASDAAKNGDLEATRKHLGHSRRLLKKEYSTQKANALIATAKSKKKK